MNILMQAAVSFVVLLGALITVLSLIGVMRPKRLVQLVESAMAGLGTWWIALFIRLVLGLSLVVCAHISLLPRAFLVLGWLLILSAGVMLIAGQDRVRKLMRWLGESSPFAMRAWCTLGALFGASLVYGVIGEV